MTTEIREQPVAILTRWAVEDNRNVELSKWQKVKQKAVRLLCLLALSAWRLSKQCNLHFTLSATATL